MKLKKIACLMMAGAMLLSMGGMTAFATVKTENALNDDGATETGYRVEGTATGGAEVSAELKITKNLFMAPDVKTPDKSFNFTVTPFSVDGVPYAAATTDPVAPANMPTLGTAATGGAGTFVIDIDSSEADTPAKYSDGIGAFHEEKQGGDTTKVVTGTSTDILAGVTSWPHAGEYIYTIKETKPSDASGEDDPEITYSTAEYEIHIYVANKYTDGNKDTYNPTVPNPNELYVAAVGVYVKANEFDDSLTVETKVNANDGVGITGTGSQFAFKNIYTPLSDLRVEKKLVGAYADRTKKFSFKLALTLPAASVAKRADTYNAYICKADGTTDGTPIPFTDGDSDGVYKPDQDFELSDGQYLQFGHYEDGAFTTAGVLPVGTTYTLSETLVDGYEPSVEVYYADGSTNPVKDNLARIFNGEVTTSSVDNNNQLIVGDASANKKDETKDAFLKNNQTIITNTYDAITPTGILIDNLPAILLIAAAVGGAVLYIISKKRRSER